MRTLLWQRLIWSAACMASTLLSTSSPAFADATRDSQWHLSALQAAQAQKTSKGAGILVAVVDTGVSQSHIDLTGNVLPGLDFNIKGTKGWVDHDGHGTAMAGLIAAHGHGLSNSAGALGIAPAAKIFPVRVLKDQDRSSSDIPQAIDAAVEHGAKVISMSFSTTDSPLLRRSVSDALKSNVVLVAAAGNRPDDVFVQYPARYPGVIAVGASGSDGNIAPISTTGDQVVLTAPGTKIVSTSRTGAYQQQSGTSEATAIVAGAAALVRSRFPDLSAVEVVRRLTVTATDKGAPGRDPDYGFGELNLVAALTADVPPVTPTPTTAAATTPSAAGSGVALPAAGPAVRVNWVVVLIVVAGFVGLLVAGVVLVLWLVGRSRRRRSSSSGPGYPRGFGPWGRDP